MPRGTVLDDANGDHRAAYAYEVTRRHPNNLRLVELLRHLLHRLPDVDDLPTALRAEPSSAPATQVGLLVLTLGSAGDGQGFILLFTALARVLGPMAALRAGSRRRLTVARPSFSSLPSRLLRHRCCALISFCSPCCWLRGVAASCFSSSENIAPNAGFRCVLRIRRHRRLRLPHPHL